MDTSKVVEILRKESESNPVSKAALTAFCLRERPRSTLTLVGLEHSMKTIHHFPYQKKDYIPLLKAMAEAGVGKLSTDRNGEITGIEGVEIVFKDLGEAVLQKRQNIRKFTPRRKFKKFTQPQAKVVNIVKKPETISKPKIMSIGLQVSVNGKVVHIPVPKDLSNEDVAELIGRFKQ